MNLNPKKCKITTICPLQTKPVSPMLSINNLPLEAVSSYKVLGLTLCDTLKWNDNTNEIVSKASKCILINHHYYYYYYYVYVLEKGRRLN